MKLNNFRADLKYSEEQNDDQLLNDFYYKVFPNIEEIKTIQDLSLQKKGVDKIIILRNGKEIKIDEKKRRKDYGDILLEEWSNYEARKKGWTGDPEKITDFIVYIIIPKIYLIPYDLLQLAWRRNYNNWFRAYGRKEARNNNYITTNIPVPSGVLMDSIGKAMFYEDITAPIEGEVILSQDLSIQHETLLKISNIESHLEELNNKVDYLFQTNTKKNIKKVTSQDKNTLELPFFSSNIISIPERKQVAS